MNGMTKWNETMGEKDEEGDKEKGEGERRREGEKRVVIRV